jgi:hypothetical protein
VAEPMHRLSTISDHESVLAFPAQEAVQAVRLQYHHAVKFTCYAQYAANDHYWFSFTPHTL